jgi:hypothetical protein
MKQTEQVIARSKQNGLLYAKSIEVDFEYYENSQYHYTLQSKGVKKIDIAEID